MPTPTKKKKSKLKKKYQLSFPIPDELRAQIEKERTKGRSEEPTKLAVFCRILLRAGLATLKS